MQLPSSSIKKGRWRSDPDPDRTPNPNRGFYSPSNPQINYHQPYLAKSLALSLALLLALLLALSPALKLAINKDK